MNSYKHLTILLLTTAAIQILPFEANAANWTLTPTITLSETYTDNVDLDATSQQSDFVTQVVPQISLIGVGPRLDTQISYAANYFYYPGDATDKHDLRHNLQASLNSELVKETFFIESSASINQRFLDRRQAISSNVVSRTDNRRTVQTYSLSPYLVRPLGSWATAKLRYDLRYIRQSSDTQQTTPNTFFGNSTSHYGSLSIDSGREFSKLNWSLLGQYGVEKREIFSDYKTTLGRLDLSYQVNRSFSLLGSAGYQKRDANNSFANFDGFIWDAGFRLVPGPRTSLSFRYGNQYSGKTFSLDAQYKITSKNSLNLSYTDIIQTYQNSLFNENISNNIDPTQNSGFVSGDLTRRKQWLLSLNGSRGRTTYAARAYYSRYTSDNSLLDEKRYSGSVSLNRNLSPKLSAGAQFTYNLSKFRVDNRDDTYWSASANINYKISKSLLGTVSYVHSDRNQARFARLNGGSNYVSLSIRAAL